MNILVLEGDAVTAAGIVETLKSWDQEVEISGTGREAMKKVRDKKFEVALLDIYLPGLQGAQIKSVY